MEVQIYAGIGTIGSGAITSSGTIQGTTITATTAFVPDASDGAALGTTALEFSDLFLADASTIQFGADQDVTITHVADTGILVNGSSKIQFTNAAESIHSDGSKLILTSNSVAFSLPTADGSSGQILQTNGSGVLSFATASANTPSSADGQALGSASLEWSDLFLADGGTIQFGNDQEIRLTHNHNTGLILTHTASDDNNPISLTLKSEEDAIIADEVIGSLHFSAGDSDGTDGATIAAGIHAIAEGTFSASANATKLVFTTGVSEAAVASATAKMTLSSAGLLTIADDLVIKDGGTIGVASDADAITIASNGQLTLTQTLIGTALDISGDIDVDGTTNLDVVDIDGAVDMASTLGVAGVVTANAGVVVDNITIDGTEIDLSSGDLTVDVAGDIILDADTRNIKLQDGGTDWGRFTRDTTTSPSSFVIDTVSSDVDMKFKGNDGGSAITALTLDMSAAGNATFNGSIFSGGNVVVPNGNGIDFSATADGTTMASELLDDYEEGTFSPTAAATSATITHSVKAGQYTKIGDRVFFNVYMQFDGSNTLNSNAVSISGFPFTSNSTGANIQYIKVFGRQIDYSSGYHDLAILLNTGTSTAQLFEFGDNNAQQGIASSALSHSSGQLYFQGSYRV